MRVLPLVIGAATTGAIVFGARRRARDHRLVADGAHDTRVRGPGPRRPGRRRGRDARGEGLFGVVAATGRAARGLARPAGPDRAADIRIGTFVIAAVVALVSATAVSPAFGASMGAVLVSVPVLRRRGARAARDRRIAEELPDVIDLCRIALDGGLTVRHALEAVVAHGSGAVVDELAAVLGQTARGVRLGDALPALRGLGPAAHGFVDTLVAAERYGAAAGPGLDRAAAEARAARRRLGEEAARRVPVKMLFPLVLCTLPALGLLTVLPLLARSLPSIAP